MSESKLRDVVEGAMADLGLDPEDCQDFIELLQQRLSKAMLIELDDATVFVRRPPLRKLR